VIFPKIHRAIHHNAYQSRQGIRKKPRTMFHPAAAIGNPLPDAVKNRHFVGGWR
jgi:hypothetical protein